MSGYTKELARPTVLYESHALLAAAASANSGYMRMPSRKLVITKKHTTGTYAIVLSWSMDGTNEAFSTTPIMVDNVPQSLDVLAPWVKATITATIAQFTVHQTTLMTGN